MFILTFLSEEENSKDGSILYGMSPAGAYGTFGMP